MEQNLADDKQLGQKLRELRGNRKQGEVAKAVNISISTLSMYENGERVPRDEVKKRLADYFGITVGTLFFNEISHLGCNTQKTPKTPLETTTEPVRGMCEEEKAWGNGQ